MTRLLLVMVPAAVAAGTMTLWCSPSMTPTQWAAALMLVLLAVLAQRTTAVTRWLGLGQSLMGVVQGVSWGLAGPYAALLACFAPLVASRQRHPNALVYNISTFVIMSCAGWWGFHLLGGVDVWHARDPLWQVAVPVAVGSVVQLCTNVLLILPGLAVFRGHRVAALARDANRVLRVGSLNHVVGAVLASVLVWAVQPHGLGLLLASGPLLVHMAILTTIEAAERGQTQALRVISRTAHVSDPYVEEHGARVAVYSQELARHLRLGPHELERLDLAARLHDIGWVALPSEQVDRETAHAAQGARMLADLPFLDAAARLIRDSHARIGEDESPRGRGGDLQALQVLQVADALDAVVCARPQATVEEVADLLAEEPGRYAPIVVEALRNCRPVIRRPAEGAPLPDWWVHDLPPSLRSVVT